MQTPNRTEDETVARSRRLAALIGPGAAPATFPAEFTATRGAGRLLQHWGEA